MEKTATGYNKRRSRRVAGREAYERGGFRAAEGAVPASEQTRFTAVAVGATAASLVAFERAAGLVAAAFGLLDL